MGQCSLHPCLSLANHFTLSSWILVSFCLLFFKLWMEIFRWGMLVCTEFRDFTVKHKPGALKFDILTACINFSACELLILLYVSCLFYLYCITHSSLSVLRVLFVYCLHYMWITRNVCVLLVLLGYYLYWIMHYSYCIRHYSYCMCTSALVLFWVSRSAAARQVPTQNKQIWLLSCCHGKIRWIVWVEACSKDRGRQN